MNNNSLSNADLSSLASHADTVKYVAQAFCRGIELASERQAWIARIEIMNASFDRYGKTEENVLEERRLKADMLRFAIEKAAALGDSQAIVVMFKEFNSENPDFLGKFVDFIKAMRD